VSRKKRIRSHYTHRITPERDNYDILDWASAASQRERFDVLAREIDLAGKSLLDVGSGLGDLWAYLKDHRLGVDYTGVDILDEMVRVAERMHPDATFIRGDIFGDDAHPLSEKRFDVVFCSGALNLDLGNNREFLPIAAARLLDLAREAAVFNLLRVRRGWADQTYAYYDPADVMALLAPLPCTLRIVEDYLPNDFTVVCTPR